MEIGNHKKICAAVLRVLINILSSTRTGFSVVTVKNIGMKNVRHIEFKSCVRYKLGMSNASIAIDRLNVGRFFVDLIDI
jgi:hypothetical protein